MKRDRIVLAAFGVFILCAVGYCVIMRPSASREPFGCPVVVPAVSSARNTDATRGRATETEANTSAIASSAGPSQRVNKTLSMAPLLEALLGDDAAPAPDDPVTEPETCIFLGPPHQFAFIEQDDLVLMINSDAVSALNVASGAEVWRCSLEPAGRQSGAGFGRHQVLGWSNQEVFLLDATTGRKTWSRHSNQCGPIVSARLSSDETQVAVTCEQGYLLYAVADRTQRVLPNPTNTWLYGWFSDNKTLLLAQQKGKADYAIQRLLLMDTDTGSVTPGWEPGSSWKEWPPMFSAQGQFAEAAEDGETNTALKILDARTGNVLREFKGIPGRTKYFVWLRDARRLYSLSKDRRQARVVDAETGTVQFSLSREGHHFVMPRPFEDASGKAWIFSRDDANNRYVWPLAPDGAPRQVLDGSRIAPDDFQLCVSDPCYVLARALEEEGLWTYTVYTLADVRKAGEWHVRAGKEDSWANSMVNRTMTHCVRTYVVGKDVPRPVPWTQVCMKTFAFFEA